jgi:hypothetical protein
MLRFFEKYGVKEYYMYDRLVLTKEAIEGDGCALVRVGATARSALLRADRFP